MALSQLVGGQSPLPGNAAGDFSISDHDTNLPARDPLTALEESYSALAGTELRLIGRSQIRTSTVLSPALGTANYRLGPGDRVILFLWGESIDLSLVQNPNFPTSFQAALGSDGALSVPTLGRYALQGLTLSEAREVLRTDLSRRFRRFDVSLSLTEPRQQVVWVTGFVNKPGLTAVPPGASVLEALAAAGGLSEAGTLRRIEVYRGGVKQTVDLYPLFFGGASSEVLVADGDRVVVGPLGPSAAVTGAVARPGIYEFLQSPTLDELLAWAGRPTAFANVEMARVYRPSTEGVRVFELGAQLVSGDLITIPNRPLLLQGRVSVTGPVRLSGNHPLSLYGNLRDLLGRVEPQPNHNPYYAEVRRLVVSGRPEYMTFQPRLVAQGLQNFDLKNGDEIKFFTLDEAIPLAVESGFDQRVDLRGSLRYQGPLAFVEGLQLSHLLKDFDLLLGADLQLVEVVRTEAPDFHIRALSPDLAAIRAGRTDFELKPRDQITFVPRRLNPGVRVVGQVEASAFVEFRTGLNLLDVLKGVILKGSYRNLQAVILRPDLPEPISTSSSPAPQGSTALTAAGLAAIPRPSPGMGPASGLAEAPAAPTLATVPEAAAPTPPARTWTPIQELPENRIPDFAALPGLTGQVISLRTFFETPRADQSAFVLRPGDLVLIQEIPVEARSGKVTVLGAVGRPGVYELLPGQRLSDVLRSAGGFTESAYPEALVLLRESVRRSQADQFRTTLLTLERALQDTALQAVQSQSSANAAAMAVLNAQLRAQQAQLEALKDQEQRVLGRLVLSLEKTDLTQLARDESQNLVVEENDYIFVPQRPEYVLVLGETYNPISVPFRPGSRVRDYVAQAGGASNNGDETEIYIIKANGRVVSPRSLPSFLWWRADVMGVELQPGDAVVIPPKPPTAFDWITPTRDLTTIVSQIASTALSTVALYRTLVP